MQTYNEYFNMGGYVVDPNITPWGDPVTIKKSYAETLVTPVSALQVKKPKIDPFSGIEIQETPEPTPIEEVKWEDAYPKSMLPVDKESDMWTVKDDIDISEPVEVQEPDYVEIKDEYTVEDNSTNVEEPVMDNSEELNIESTEEVKVEKTPVVKKKNTRRTKKNK